MKGKPWGSRISLLLATGLLLAFAWVEAFRPDLAVALNARITALVDRLGISMEAVTPVHALALSDEGKGSSSVAAPSPVDAPLTGGTDPVAYGGVFTRTTIAFADYALRPRPVFHTIIPERPRDRVITYTVQPGDTVFDIAARFGITPETIMWSNPELEENPDWLPVGTEVVILPVSGVYHTVKEGDTIEKLAKKYKVDPSAITDYPLNHLEGPPYALKPGQKLIIPGGQKPYKPKVVRHYTGPIPAGAARGTGVFSWPIDGVLYITQYYWRLHRAIDIGVPEGTPVYAADSGFVVYAGWNDQGYGKLVIIDHRNGFMTYYAHLSVIKVKVGMSVRKGQVIGLSGNTGRSTGPHLHFEIRLNGIPRNPLGFLH